jgi:hypothetical protein
MVSQAVTRRLVAMELLLKSPLWLGLIVLTALVHVGFFVAVRRMMRRDAERTRELEREAAASCVSEAVAKPRPGTTSAGTGRGGDAGA